MLYITRKPVMFDDSGYILNPGDLVLLISLKVQFRWYVYTAMFANGIVMQSTWNSGDLVNDYLEVL